MPRGAIGFVVTNNSYYPDGETPTGLWLSEFVHAFIPAQEAGYDVIPISPCGGVVPMEPKSLRGLAADRVTREKASDSHFRDWLNNSRRPDEVNPESLSAVYFTGGHGVMVDFPDDVALQELTASVFLSGGVVAAVCHGYCGLLNTRLTDGRYLLAGRDITGFTWREEALSGVASKVPYNAEALATQRGAKVHRAWIPFAPHVRVDGRLVTGQNPFSAKRTAAAMLELLEPPR